MKNLLYTFCLSCFLALFYQSSFGQQDTSCVGVQGKIKWYVYSDIPDNDLQDMYADPSYPLSPTYELDLLLLESITNFNNSYGSIAKGFIKVPITGDYIFNVTGNNNASFYFGEGTDPSAVTLLAHTLGATGKTAHYNWPEQTSVTLSLTAGQYHYFELHHKEDMYGDHATVYWKSPLYTDTLWRVVNGSYLYEYTCNTSCPAQGTPCDDGLPYTLNDVEDGYCNCIGEVNPSNNCIGARGDVLAMFYDSISGGDINNLYNAAKYPLEPDTAIEMSEMKMPYSFDDSYGTLVKGYLKVPVTGGYQFNITGDDDTRLYLSSGENINNISLIAEIDGWTSRTQHYKFPSQTSSVISLNSSNFYYFELHHKEGGGGDHSAIFWKTPFRPDTNWTAIQGLFTYGYDCELACVPLGTACNDHDPNTENDKYDGNCNCVGTPCNGPCNEGNDFVNTEICAPSDAYSNNAMDSWLSCQETPNPNTARGNSHWIMYDFGESLKIERHTYWNYNVESETGKGVKTVIIDYSDNQSNWTNLGTFQWPEASGLNGYAGDSIPELNGVIARYLLFTVTESWSSPSCAGFSEIVFDIRRCFIGGTACDDGDPNTHGDIYDNFCNCIGVPLVLNNPCDTPILYLTQATVNTGDYNATDKVIATADVNLGNIVTFTGGNAVRLDPGFEVNTGALFYASAEPCAQALSAPESFPVNRIIRLPDIFDQNDVLILEYNDEGVLDIHFILDDRSNVSLRLEDSDGRLIFPFIQDSALEPGQYSKRLPVQNLRPDMYHVVLQTEKDIERQRVVVMDN